MTTAIAQTADELGVDIDCVLQHMIVVGLSSSDAFVIDNHTTHEHPHNLRFT